MMMTRISESQTPSKTVVHLQAELMAEKMFTDLMASAGVNVNRMQVELMYFIPKQFRDAYIRLFRKALKGDDSDAGARGEQNHRVGILGKASGKNDATGLTSAGNTGNTADTSRGVGGINGRENRRTVFASGQTRSVASGGRGKKYKKYWTVEDERAFELKELIDKRLRRMAMEIQTMVDGWEVEGEVRIRDQKEESGESGKVISDP